MVSRCPKCGQVLAEDFTYCPYCGHGLKPSAMTLRVSVAGVLMIVASTASLVIFVLSIRAIMEIFSWYPQLVAQRWFIYDVWLTLFSLMGFLCAMFAAAYALRRRRHTLTMLLATVAMISSGSVWILSMIIPDAKLLNSILYYFLPIFLTTVIGVLLIRSHGTEFH